MHINSGHEESITFSSQVSSKQVISKAYTVQSVGKARSGKNICMGEQSGL